MIRNHLARLAGLLILLAALAGAARAAAPAPPAEVLVYDYHLKPPFLLDAEAREGLDVDIAAWLNRKAGPFRFKVVHMPRNRLNAMIEAGRLDGLIIGVDQLWFHDTPGQAYLWSPPYMRDADVVVSPRDRPVAYAGPDSLRGLRIGFPTGFYYLGISELADRGLLAREESATEESNLQKLELGRIDATIVSRSTLDYLRRSHSGWARTFFVAREPEESFQRRFLIPRSRPEVHAWLGKVLRGLEKDPQWLAVLGRYH